MENGSGHAALNARKWNKRAETYDERRFNYFRWRDQHAGRELRHLRFRNHPTTPHSGCTTRCRRSWPMARSKSSLITFRGLERERMSSPPADLIFPSAS